MYRTYGNFQVLLDMPFSCRTSMPVTDRENWQTRMWNIRAREVTCKVQALLSARLPYTLAPAGTTPNYFLFLEDYAELGKVLSLNWVFFTLQIKTGKSKFSILVSLIMKLHTTNVQMTNSFIRLLSYYPKFSIATAWAGVDFDLSNK